VFSGFAVFSISTLSFGSHNIIASYGGTPDFASSASATLTQVVGKAATTTSSGSNANPSTYGQTVAISASVFTAFGNPTGTVTFTDGATLLGAAPVINGVATLTTSTLSTGNHSIVATYSGDADFAGSVAVPLAQSVSLAPTSTSLAASTTVVTIGQPVTFTATITVAVPGFGGVVTFTDGATVLGTASVVNGVATLTTSSLSTGNHSVTAGYSGDLNFAASNSSAVAVTVNLMASTTSLGLSANPVTVGNTLTLTATVSTVGAATGKVSFFDGGTLVGSAALVNGQAVFATSSFAVGGHTLTARYSGDGLFVASASGAVGLTVNPAATSTSLTSSANPGDFGKAVTLTAAVDSPFASASGTVTFRDGSTLLGVVTLSNGVATLVLANFTAGGHALSASYGGDASHTGSTGAMTQMINRGSTATTISSSSGSSTVGQSVTFTAVVSSTVGTPTGSVTFTDGSTVIATIALSNGLAKLTTASLAAGSHSIVATYSGDTNFNSSGSTGLAQTVNKVSTATALNTSANPATAGQSVTLTATVSGRSSVSGTVTFFDGGVALGTSSVVSGVATFSTSSLSQGTHSLTASYGGDAKNAGSTSAALSLAVNPATTGTVSGHVYVDATGNGFSPDDTPFVGVIVELYADRNRNGKVDGGDGSPVATAVTDASGAYTFTNLAVGQYVVQQVIPGGYTQSAPSASAYSLNVTAGSVLGGIDFDDLLSNGKGKKK
jgi:hypothetical protein